MPFCKHGEPDHKCSLCQAARLPSAVSGKEAVPHVKPLQVSPRPLPKPVQAPVKVEPKPLARTPPGPPPSVLVNGVSKPGPVSAAVPVTVNPHVRGGGVKLDVGVVQDFWKTYKTLGVTDKSAEEAVLAAIRTSGVTAVDGFESLELAEKFALYKYTSVEYLKWNASLRDKKSTYQAHCALVSAALGKLKSEPEYSTTYRIEKFSEKRHPQFFTQGSGSSGTLKVGTEMSFAAFSSTAFNIKAVESDPQFSGAGSYVKYVISSHAGKRVNFLSLKPLECEILIDKGARFRVTGGPEQKNVFDSRKRSGAIEIHLSQVI